MSLSNKQLNVIKKQYPKKSAQQIADELHVSLSTVYRALGLQNELWSLWLENAAGILMVILLLVSPLIFIRGLHDFADMPQRIFIQTAAAVLALLGALRVLISREIAIPRSTLCWVVAALIVWSFLTLLWATNVYEGFYSTIHLAMCGVVFFAIITLLHDTKWIKWLFSASIISAGFVSITGLAQQYLQFKGIPQSVSPAATFGNPNVAADYLVIVLPSLIAMGVAQKKIVYRWFLFAALILSLIYLYNTHSRGGWLAVSCAALSVGLLCTIKKHNRGISKKGFTIGVIVITCLIITILFTKSGNRILNAALSEYRLTAWRNSIEMIRDKPVQGFGSGNFKIFYPAYSHRAVVDRAPDTTRYLGRAHNDFIQIAAELGIPGFLLFALIPFCGLALSWRLLRQSGTSAFHPFIIGLAGGLIAFMISAFFSFPMQRSVPPLLVFTYCGMLAFFNSRLPAEKKHTIIRVPQLISVVLIVAIALTGFVLMQFNIKNIICDSYYFTAVGMEKRGNNSRALSSSLDAHQYNKYRMDLLITAGRAYIATGEMQKAIEILQKVVGTTPYNLNALFLLGVAYANSNDKENALETFRRVLQIKPDFSEARKIFFSLKAHGKARVSLG